MRDFVRPVAAMLGLAVALLLASDGDAFAQAKQQQMAPPAKQAPAQAAPQPAQQPELKQIALTDLNEALKQPQPAIQNKGNIDLVIKYYDKLSEALGGDDQ